LGFFYFLFTQKKKSWLEKKIFLNLFLAGVLFHGFYLGGVFYSISIGMPTGIAALIVTLQPILTNALSGPILNEKVSTQTMGGCFIGISLVRHLF
jgi:drug/metabolite transporter (DMT)-like permease